MKRIIFFSVLAVFIACNQAISSDSYLLEANFTGIEDGTYAVLIGKGSHVLDSTKIINGKAIFTGPLLEPKNVVIATKDVGNRKFIWIEPGKKVTFTATSGSFNEAVIEGSENYNKSRELVAREKVFEDRMDELNQYASKNLDKLTRVQIDSLKKVYNEANLAYENESQVFIADYPSSFFSMYLLDFYKTTYGADKTKELFLKMDHSLKKTSHAKSILKFLEINKELKLGDQYIDVTLKNIDDKLVSLSDVKSTYTLIEFWSSRCGPCRLTNPKLVKIYKKYQPKGFQIYGISLDTKKDEWLAAVEKDGLLWENVVDLNGDDAEVALQYGISVIPHNFLINKEGKVIAINIWSENLEKKLEKLLP